MNTTDLRLKAIESRTEWILRELRNLTQEVRAVEQQLRAIDGLGGSAGSSSGSGGLILQFATTTSTGIPAASTAAVNAEDDSGTALGVTFNATNRHPTQAVGNSVKIMCLNNGVSIYVIWEACP